MLQTCPICLKGPVVQREKSSMLRLRTRWWLACRACGSIVKRVGYTYRYDAISKHHHDMKHLLESVFYDLDELRRLADQRSQQRASRQVNAAQRELKDREPRAGTVERPARASREQVRDFNEQVQRNLRAIELEKSGELHVAIKLYEQNVREDFAGDQPYDRLASIYRERGLIDDEIRILQKAIGILETRVNIGVLDKSARLHRYKKRLAKAWGIDEWPSPSASQEVVRTSIYDRRHGPPRRDPSTAPDDSKNPHILKWWTPSHDELLARQIAKEEWHWSHRILDQILAITPQEVIEAWKIEDPAYSNSGYNILYYFAISRAERLGLTKAIRDPESRICPLCGCWFAEDSLPGPLVKRLGIHQLDFCAPCLKHTVLQATGSDSLSRQEVLTYLRDLTHALERVPSQGFGERVDDLRDLSTQERLPVLKLLQRKPTVQRVKELFGSWFEALIEAGVLDDDARRLSRGTQCLARDGHICYSLGEKTIDDALYALGIPHDKEVSYPEGNLRADFAVNDVFIEYFGLAGDADYDAKTRHKQSICKKHGIKLIAIYPTTLASPKKLKSLLTKGLSH